MTDGGEPASLRLTPVSIGNFIRVANSRESRSTSQYDDLARVPRAQSRAGCRRRTIASGDRRRASARCSCRVVPPIRNARVVDLIRAVFIQYSGRCQERVWGAQRPEAKIDAIASYLKFRAARAPVSHSERLAGNLARALARLEPRPAPVQRRNSTGHRSELARPTPALVRDQAVLPAATV